MQLLLDLPGSNTPQLFSQNFYTTVAAFRPQRQTSEKQNMNTDPLLLRLLSVDIERPPTRSCIVRPGWASERWSVSILHDDGLARPECLSARRPAIDRIPHVPACELGSLPPTMRRPDMCDCVCADSRCIGDGCAHGLCASNDMLVQGSEAVLRACGCSLVVLVVLIVHLYGAIVVSAVDVYLQLAPSSLPYRIRPSRADYNSDKLLHLLLWLIVTVRVSVNIDVLRCGAFR